MGEGKPHLLERAIHNRRCYFIGGSSDFWTFWHCLVRKLSVGMVGSVVARATTEPTIPHYFYYNDRSVKSGVKNAIRAPIPLKIRVENALNRCSTITRIPNVLALIQTLLDWHPGDRP
jgi:hypothetical protein